MSSLVFPQSSFTLCHVKYLIHLNRLMFAKVEKMSQSLLLDRRLAHFSSQYKKKIWEADLQLQGNHLITM